ncbi:MAG TPA: sigma-54 dependent transcriptional regulator [Rhodopila sp.]|jgi:transcriptional regulator with PAS, ATPase and Fis domain|nr:sigma-54 dependent transcriptional regulator [Rhodopila sp.]
MTAWSAPGFLVPDDLESVFPQAESAPGRLAPFPPSPPHRKPADGVVWRDNSMLAVVQRAQRIAQSDASVLLRGESGTGKEVIARYIHRHSPRAAGPFVAVNCAAIPDQLLESELFGHERGAFSGAVGQRIGKLEAAQNGTILLDEISEMDRRLQAKLLRALQEREIDRIGGRAPVRLNVRVLATTNKDLEQEVARQNFREDLYFRLNVVSIHIPALRDRPDDIVALADHFIDKYRAATGRASGRLSQPALDLLLVHDWPGNVRELENTIHRAMVLTPDGVIGPRALEIGPPSASPRPAQSAAGIAGFIGRPLHVLEREVILGTLGLTGGNRTKAASLLGLSIRALRNKISLYAAQGIAVPPSSAAVAPSAAPLPPDTEGARTITARTRIL